MSPIDLGHLALLRLRHIGNGLLVANDICARHDRERRQHLGNIAPPLLAKLAVPLHRDVQALSEGGLLIPAQLAQLGTIHSIAVVVEGPVMRVFHPLLHVLLRLVRDAKLGQQLAAQCEVGDLVVRAHVVHLTELALVQNGIEGVGRVAGKQVAPRRGAVAVQDDGLGTVQQAAELGDDFLRVLVRAVDVVAADDDDGQLERLLVRVHEHLGGGLGGGVGIGGRQDARLEQVVVIILDLAVDLVGGNVDEAFDADLLGALEQYMGAIDVGVSETVRVAETQVDVGLRGEVEDGVDVVPLQAVDDFAGVGDVAVVEVEIPLVVQHACVV